LGSALAARWIAGRAFSRIRQLQVDLHRHLEEGLAQFGYSCEDF
jgi:hypothetical protein